MTAGFEAAAVLARLERAWSAESSGKWREEAPALGQCSVTALLLQARFGGDILQTPTPWGPHFYNRIEGRRLDLTAAQFAALGAAVPPYLDQPASREAAMADTSPAQYAALCRAWDRAGT
jgi:hypothetical protein